MAVLSATIDAVSTDTGSNGDFNTSDRTLTISGTMQLNALPSVLGIWLVGGPFGEGTLVGTVSTGLLNLSTPWSFDLSTSSSTAARNIEEGNYTIVLTDNVLFPLPLLIPLDSQSLKVDLSAPTAVASITGLSDDSGTAGDFITNVQIQSVSGSLTGVLAIEERIEVSADGATWVEASLNGNAWTASGVELKPGDGLLQVRTVDEAGNATNGPSRAYVLDTTPPTSPTVNAPGGADGMVSGQPGDSTLTGTAPPNSVVTVTTGGTILGTTTSDDSGQWSYPLTPGNIGTVGQGVGKVVSVTVADDAGNTATSTSGPFTVDTIPPTAVGSVTGLSEDTGVPGDFITTVQTQTVSGSLSGSLGAGEGIQVSTDGASWIDAVETGNTWSASGVVLQPGSGILSVRTVDAAGNTTDGTDRAYTLQAEAGGRIVSIAPFAADRNEGNSGTTAFTFVVSLDAAAETAQSVNWSVAGSGLSPASDADFQGGFASGQLTFAAGETSKVITVNVTGDGQVEANETFTVSLSGASAGLFVGNASAVGTIRDDDGDTPGGPQNPSEQDIGNAGDHLGAINDAYVVLEGKQLVASGTAGVLFNDEFSPVSAALIQGAQHGTVQLNANGGFTYQPVSGFAGIDFFTYEATYANGVDDVNQALVYVVPTIEGPITTTLDLFALTREEQVATVYTAFFGRGADADGFNFWVNEFLVNESTKPQNELFAGIASSFGISDEAKGIYTFLQDPFDATDPEIHTFLDAVYNNLFNRTTDSEGRAYWTNEIKETLASGEFVGSVLIEIIGGSQNTATGLDITTLMSKVAVNLEYVQVQEQFMSQWTFADDRAEAVALLDPVGSDQKSVLIGLVQASEYVQADVA